MTRSRYPNEVNAQPWKLSKEEQDEYAGSCFNPSAGAQCQETLHFGFFFDGTRNNIKYDEAKKAHSNVARLWRAYEDVPRPNESKRYRFATYIPGVGTEFWQELADAGVGLHASAGAAAGWGGEARINWALLQLQNNLHFHCFKNPLTTQAEDRALVARMSTDITLARMRQAFPPAGNPPTPQTPADTQSRAAVSTQQAVQAVISTQWRGVNTDARRGLLAERRAQLKEALTPLLTKRLPKITQIRISVFGFSRGAAEARVFVNWLRDLCDNPAGPMQICGVPAVVDFLGIFDTVASVGAAQSFLDNVASGHGGWAAPRDLRIPDASVVARCVHMVSGHEVRGSFPVDAAAGGNVEEIVYPGVHSDIGGGYLPGEQGRGIRDAAKLSQIPLCDMYRAALAAGVPLIDVAGNPDFAVDAGLIGRFNAYINEVRGSGGESDTKQRVQTHYAHFLRWRRYRIGTQASLPCVAHAPRQDRTDLIGANDELNKELAWMGGGDGVSWFRNQLGFYSGGLFDMGAATLARLLGVGAGGVGGPVARVVFADLPGGPIALLEPGFGAARNMFYGSAVAAAIMEAYKSKWAQWRQVKKAWDEGTRAPSPAICDLFENDVHDSRAWFKPFGDDDDVWEKRQQERIKTLLAREQAYKMAAAPGAALMQAAPLTVGGTGVLGAALDRPAPLSAGEKEELAIYRRKLAAHGKREGDLSPELLPTQSGGRENFVLWGYLRWRTVYRDRYMDYRHDYPALAQADRGRLKSRKSELERTIKNLSAQADSAQRPYSQSMSMPPPETMGQLLGLHQALTVAEKELEAIECFLAELPADTWW